MRRQWFTPAAAIRFKPYRKIFIIAAAVSGFFSLIVVFENIFFLTASFNQSAFALLLPYLLSWALITLACVFGRIAFLLHTANDKCAIVRPLSPGAWSTADSRPVSPFSVDTLSASYSSQRHGPCSAIPMPHSPFCVTEEIQRYVEEPPSYAEAVRSSNGQALINPTR